MGSVWCHLTGMCVSHTCEQRGLVDLPFGNLEVPLFAVPLVATWLDHCLADPISTYPI